MDKIQWVALLLDLRAKLGLVIQEVEAGALRYRAIDLESVIGRELEALGYGSPRLYSGATHSSRKSQVSQLRDQMAQLAEIGASLCCYAPGAGNPEAWPSARCDCKYIPLIGPVGGEQTGCSEVRNAYWALERLAEKEKQHMPDYEAEAKAEQPNMTDSAALDQIAAILGLHSTDPAGNPTVEILADIVGYVQATGRRTDVPEGA